MNATGTQRSAHLVAPELAPALAFFPPLDFSGGTDGYRILAKNRPPRPLPPELEAVTCIERWIPGLDGAPQVRVLHYQPPGAAVQPRPAVLHMHGGGFVLGDPELNDASNRAMVLAHDCVIVSVDYRLAPETLFPGALQDCYAALCWLHDHAVDLDVDPDRIAIAGESAGAGHAAALAIHARDHGGPAICLQLLESPMLDDRTGGGADLNPFCGEFVWTPDRNRFGWASLLGMEPGGDEVPYGAVPARVANLSGLPAAFISVGALDLFLEEDVDYARRLARAGVPIELHVIPGAYHGFGIAVTSPQTAALQHLRHAALARAFARADG